MSRSFSGGVLLLCLVLLSSALSAATADLILGSDNIGGEPTFRVLTDRDTSLKIEFTLPSLGLEELVLDSEQFQALTIPGGAIEGEDGRPGLPVITRMITIPDGVGVLSVVTAEDKTSFNDYRLLPVQPDDATGLVIDRAAYAEKGRTAPRVEVGAPAILRDLRVVPVTFRPVSYDPVAGTVTVAHRLEVVFEFSGEDDRAPAPPNRNFIPQSFVDIYADMVLNYNGAGSDRSDDTIIGPGTILYIAPNYSAVTSRLEPLLEWRRRQGYRVILSTQSAGSTSGQILDYIQGAYNSIWPPLEHVVLVGDANGTYSVPCWYEGLIAGGEGDHYYTMLAGSDVLADIHIGRLSIRTTADLDVIIDKILTYELDPPLADSGWFSRACLVGDPSSSGITTIYVNQWLKGQLLANGYSQVDTIWGGNFSSQIQNGVNQGISAFGYRGYWHMSEVSSTQILAMTNGDKLPLAIVVTCDTGSFSDDNTCRSEAFLRAANGGGIASVGTATIATHTRYNNCYYHGVWEGALNGASHQFGAAHTRGKLELYNNYQLTQPGTVEAWCVWNNLMGDPVVQLRTAVPTELAVEHPSTLPLGADMVMVNVTDGQHPVTSALVALYKEDEVQISAYTDEHGDVYLPLADYTEGELLVTVSGFNLRPYLGSLMLSPVSGLTVDDQMIDDDNAGASKGNDDMIINPGETIELQLALLNLGTTPFLGIDARMYCDNPHIDIHDDVEPFGIISGHQKVWSEGSYVFNVSPYAEDGETLIFNMEIGAEGAPWRSQVRIDVQSALLNFDSWTWQGSGATPDPGETGGLVVSLLNSGSLAAAAVEARLFSNSPWVEITESDAQVGTIPVSSSGDNASVPFQIAIADDCAQGHLAQCELVLTYNEGAAAVIPFSLAIGNISSDDPTGPDTYGYFAFDNTDTSYDEAPVYDWLEIDPNFSGPGTSVGLTDYSYEDDDTRVLDLPFTFTYYGVDYNQISVCSNGWAAMGVTSLVHYRNWSIPSAGSPNSMIAPFWDNLVQTYGGNVYYYHDSANHSYYIEWSRVRGQGSTAQIFEMILLDPAHHPTETGDGEIIFQYQQIVNNDSTNGYATVGIQNPDRTDGLLYTYWNQYTPGSSTLVAGRAIRFVPKALTLTPEIEIMPGSLSSTLMPGDTGSKLLTLANTGDAGSRLHFTIEKMTADIGGAFPVWLQPATIEGDISVGETVEIEIGFDTAGLEQGTYNARLRIELATGGVKMVPVTLIVSDGTGVVDTPAAIYLAQNHPNPFNPTTQISFGLPEAGQARLEVFDVSGRRVRVLLNEALPAGRHQATWDGTDDGGTALATGLYFYSLTAGDRVLKAKMLLLK
ncbi:MAG: T9SS type A sorting domain-containing protein [bacterium]|nr:T9SS type A sorting domain-containing protein [bacterium]